MTTYDRPIDAMSADDIFQELRNGPSSFARQEALQKRLIELNTHPEPDPLADVQRQIQEKERLLSTYSGPRESIEAELANLRHLEARLAGSDEPPPVASLSTRAVVATGTDEDGRIVFSDEANP